jgi:hypothetical protein
MFSDHPDCAYCVYRISAEEAATKRGRGRAYIDPYNPTPPRLEAHSPRGMCTGSARSRRFVTAS